MPMTHVRRNQAESFTITPRVLALLSAVGRFGVLSSEQLARLDGGSRQNVIRLLKKCVDHELLRRPERQDPFLTEFFDARPETYALTQKGARLLANAPTPMHVTPSRATVALRHNLEVAEAMFRLDAAVAADQNLRLIDEHQLRPMLPERTKRMHKPFELRPTVHASDLPAELAHLARRPVTIPIRHDRVFALVTKHDNLGWPLGLELDLGNEDVDATKLKGKATILRKHISCFIVWRDGLHVEQWGAPFKALRWGFVTTSERRIESMLAKQRLLLGDRLPNLFLYTTLARYKSQTEGPLAPIWITSQRDGVSILEPLHAHA